MFMLKIPAALQNTQQKNIEEIIYFTASEQL